MTNRLEQLIEECQKLIDEQHDIGYDHYYTRIPAVNRHLMKLTDMELLEILGCNTNIMHHVTSTHDKGSISIYDLILESLADYLMLMLH